MRAIERQITFQAYGHILTNCGVWSPDGKWIVYDVRSDPAGSLFDGTRIERVHVETGEVQVLYKAKNGACVGVATCSPVDDRIIFILGPENPTTDWSYSAHQRQGVLVDTSREGTVQFVDARDLTPPFTPGALRGGTHLHTFSGDGQWVTFTYEDHVLSQFERPADEHDINQRNVGVSIPDNPVIVKKDHPRNHDGTHFSVLVTQTTASPCPGSDEISKAYEEAWVGTDGYLKATGIRQHRAMAFQGNVTSGLGKTVAEVFIVDLPENIKIPGGGPLEGTDKSRPMPPRGVLQRRLTFTTERKFPGLQGPRHWLRSSPDGSQIAFLMRDDEGIVQIWIISPTGGCPRQLTANPWDIASAFTWSPIGRFIAHAMDNSVFTTDASSGESYRLTPRCSDLVAPRPEACVFSPNGKKIAYVRHVPCGTATFNQVFVTEISEATS